MEDLLKNIAPIAVIIILTLAQSLFGKKKKKEQSHETGSEVLNSPFPEVDYEPQRDLHEDLTQEEPSYRSENPQNSEKKQSTLKDFGKILMEALGEEISFEKPTPTPIQIEPQTIPQQHLSKKEYQHDSTSRIRRKKEETEVENNSYNNIDFSDPEEVKRAFIASLIFERKY